MEQMENVQIEGMTPTTDTLVETKMYLQTGSHIGAKFKTFGMLKFIYKNRKDKLKVLDVTTIDQRIRIVSKFLAQFESKDVIIVARKQYGQKPVEKFARLTGAKAITGRFVPGTFTNPLGKEFIEPKVVVITDPSSDGQAIREAKAVKVPIVALCSTDNDTQDIDLILPINNKGRQSLALVYWLLAREILKNKGILRNNEEYTEKIEDFEFQLKDEETRVKPENTSKRERMR